MVKATSGDVIATRSVTVTVTNVDEDGSVTLSPSAQPTVGDPLTAALTDLDGGVPTRHVAVGQVHIRQPAPGIPTFRAPRRSLHAR